MATALTSYTSHGVEGEGGEGGEGADESIFTSLTGWWPGAGADYYICVMPSVDCGHKNVEIPAGQATDNTTLAAGDVCQHRDKPVLSSASADLPHSPTAEVTLPTIMIVSVSPLSCHILYCCGE